MQPRAKTHVEKIEFELLDAFSIGVSGKKDLDTLCEWQAGLLKRIKDTAEIIPIVGTEDVDVIVNKDDHARVKAEPYNNLAAEFKPKDTATNKIPILKLMGEMYRIAASIDLVCQLEDENKEIAKGIADALHQKNGDKYNRDMAEQCARHLGKIQPNPSEKKVHSLDLKIFNQDKKAFVETFVNVGNEHMNACALNNLGLRFIEHEEEIKKLQSRVKELEKKHNEDEKQAIIAKINELQLKLKQLAKGDLLDKENPLPMLASKDSGSQYIQQYQQDYKNLQQYIAVLNDHFARERERYFDVPVITQTKTEALKTITQLAEEAKTVAPADKVKEIQSKLNGIHFYSSWLLWKSHPQWDSLRDHCVELYNTWTCVGDRSISARVTAILETRTTMLRDHLESDFDYCQSIVKQQGELKKENESLKQFHVGFCRQVIVVYQEQFLKQLKANQSRYQTIEHNYADLQQRLNRLQPKAVAERKSVVVVDQLANRMKLFGLNPEKEKDYRDLTKPQEVRFQLNDNFSVLFTATQIKLYNPKGEEAVVKTMPEQLKKHVPMDFLLRS